MQLSGGNFPSWELCRGAIARGVIVWGAIVLGGNCPWGGCLGGNCQGGNCPAENCPVPVIFIRFKLKDGSYCVNFVASKTKINPVERKNLTIPKLELMACALLNQLMFSVYSSLQFNYKDMNFFVGLTH